MLHTNTVLKGTLDLLKNLMAIPELEGFNLAGGTSLALQIGHRHSVDLDLFGARPFQKQEILDLVGPLGKTQAIHVTRNILVLNIAGVKVDFVNYQYPWVGPLRIEDGLRLVSLEDIGAMKLGAIAGRGRKRDFTDLFFLMKQFSLAELLGFYNQKYHDGSEFMVLRSLAYFADAEGDEAPELFLPAPWQTVKTTIETAVQTHFR